MQAVQQITERYGEDMGDAVSYVIELLANPYAVEREDAQGWNPSDFYRAVQHWWGHRYQLVRWVEDAIADDTCLGSVSGDDPGCDAHGQEWVNDDECRYARQRRKALEAYKEATKRR